MTAFCCRVQRQKKCGAVIDCPEESSPPHWHFASTAVENNSSINQILATGCLLPQLVLTSYPLPLLHQQCILKENYGLVQLGFCFLSYSHEFF